MEAANRLVLPELASVDAAARFLGISRGYLYKLENGEKKPSFEMLETIAEKYGVMMGDLLPSSSPRGGEIDRLIAPLAMLPRDTQSRLITQLAAFARALAGEYDALKATAQAEASSTRGPDGATDEWSRRPDDDPGGAIPPLASQ